MGDSLKQTFANVFLFHFEKKMAFRMSFTILLDIYKRYVDDILVTSDLPTQLLKLVDFFNDQHANIKFLFETG